MEEEGAYFLTLSGDACPSADTVIVLASSCGKISVYVPNAFSPNDDGRNDLFLPYFDPNYSILDFELKVFDRWGGWCLLQKIPRKVGMARSKARRPIRPFSFTCFSLLIRTRANTLSRWFMGRST